jgi:hypothetical protein
MRLASLAIACLALASTAAAGSISATAPAAKPVCSANLQKVEKTAGYKVVRQCAGGLDRAGQPVVGGLGQDEGSSDNALIIGTFGAVIVVGGILALTDDDDRPVSP